MKVIIRAAMITMLLCVGIGMAGAQSAGQNASPAPNTQAQQNTRSGHGAPMSQPPSKSDSSGPPGTLSHDLNRSRGVIHPPSTGDGGVVTPPSQGTSSMHVIPPPGSPGGNPRVQPK